VGDGEGDGDGDGDGEGDGLGEGSCEVAGAGGKRKRRQKAASRRHNAENKARERGLGGPLLDWGSLGNGILSFTITRKLADVGKK
jgi:hypothetical protein